ncbi:MAG: preprotein translocase subunit SecG [Betaproteobacteria bacterium]|nr:preprotein translocase subunit SecG [Betaproteobacteria bacterium]
MYQLLLVFNLGCAVLMVVAVLMQQGRGAEMGSSFGRGASGALVGASGSANFVSRATSLLATGFFASALAMAIIGKDDVAGRVLEGIDAVGEEVVPAVPDVADVGEAEAVEAAEPAAGGEIPVIDQ